MKRPNFFIPEGWRDNSPAVHCGDLARQAQSRVPEGRLTRLNCAWAAIFAGCVLLPNVATAQEPAATDSSQTDLDAQLLEDLGGDLFDESPDEGATELDKDLREFHGEDIGQSSPADDPHLPLERIGMQMRSAQRLLAERDGFGRATRLQDQILQDLDELIKQAQRQRKHSQKPGKSSPGSQRSDAKPQGGQQGQAAAEGQQPAADSTDNLREGTSETGSPADRQATRTELLKNLWGHLPERVRQQMLQSADDEFLPKYELEIEQYFRRLAEDPDLDGR